MVEAASSAAAAAGLAAVDDSVVVDVVTEVAAAVVLREDGKGETLKSNARNPLPTNYRPELDVTEELGPELLSRYLQLVGILRWAEELGRIDIFHECSIMSQYQANPRAGHLQALYHIFAYLKSHTKMGRIAYDAKDPDVDMSVFATNADWTEFYGDVEKRSYPRECLSHAVDP